MSNYSAVDNVLASQAHVNGSIAGKPPSDEDLASRFRPIFKRIAEGAVARERSRKLAFEAVGWLREAGFGAVRVPQAYGGAGATLLQLFRLLVELGEADSNLVQVLRAHFAFVEDCLTIEEESVKRRWFSRIVARGLLGAAMAERGPLTETNVTLTRNEDHWILNGEKYYSTGTIYSDWISVFAASGEERAVAIVSATADGVTLIDDWNGFGQRLTGSGTTRFENVKIPDEHIIRRGKLGDLFRGDSYLLAYYQQFHITALAGISRAILRDAIEFVQGRTRTFGVEGKSSPRTDPLVQRVIGRLSSIAFTAETLVDSVASALDHAYREWSRGVRDEAVFAATDIKAFQAQQISIGLVLEAASLLFEVGGASATSDARCLDRHWRNARTISSHNPAIIRERMLGDYFLNGVSPRQAWKSQNPSAALSDSTPSDSTEKVQNA